MGRLRSTEQDISHSSSYTDYVLQFPFHICIIQLASWLETPARTCAETLASCPRTRGSAREISGSHDFPDVRLRDCGRGNHVLRVSWLGVEAPSHSFSLARSDESLVSAQHCTHPPSSIARSAARGQLALLQRLLYAGR